MEMDDIQDVNELATSTPEEAAENIDDAQIFNIPPDQYRDRKTELKPQVERFKAPTTVPKPVADFMRQSPEHAALAKPDTDILGHISNVAKSVSDAFFDRPSTDQKIIDLSLKRMANPAAWTEDDNLNLYILNQQRKEFETRDYGINGIEMVPAKVAGVVSELGRSVGRNAELIAGFVTAGAGAGALAGSVLPGWGTAAGALSGGGSGLTAGLTAAAIKDGYTQTTGAMYNELSNLTDDQGNPKVIDEATKANIARGVGTVAAVTNGLMGAAIAKTTPWLSKFISPTMAKTIVMDPSKEALRATFSAIGASTVVGAGGGSFQEIANIIGEEMGKTYNGTEASFMNALSAASQKIGEYSQRVAAGAVKGGLTTGGISAALGAAGFKATKAKFQAAEDTAVGGARDVTPSAPKQIGNGPVKAAPTSDIVPPAGGAPRSPFQQSIKVLQLQDAIENIAAASKSTKMSQISPYQLSQMRKGAFAATGMSKVFVDSEKLAEFANNEKKALAVRNLLDPSGTAASQMNAPIAVPMHQFMDIVDVHPEFSDLVKLDPEGPTPNDARSWLEAHKKSQEQRADVLAKLGAGELKESDVAAMQQALESPVASNDVFSEQDYLNQPTFTRAIEGVLGETEISNFNEAQKNARQSVANAINESATLEMDRVRDVVEEQALETQMEIERDRVANDPNIQIVDRFTGQDDTFFPTARRPERTGLTEAHYKQGFSEFAIDPRTLPDKLKKYLDDPQLKKHKVFVKGGISADESARLIGVNSGENLLKILAATPSRSDVIKAGVEQRAQAIRYEVEQNVGLNETAIAKAYNNNTLNHLKEMKFMRTKEWPATKTGIRRIALPLPRIEELTAKAKSAVAQTKVGDLNVNQYKVGERKSQRLAIDNILKNDVEQAFMNKESAALASEFAKETHLAIGRVNRVFRFARRFNKPEVMQELKDAGKIYENAANEILDVFNLNPSKKGVSEQGDYAKFVERMVEEGKGDFEIPERLSDVRQSASEMTVEQVELIGARLKNLLHQAQMKNELYNKFEDQKFVQSVDAIAAGLHEVAVAHPGYEINKGMAKQGALDLGQKVGKALMSTKALLSNAEHILERIDRKSGGSWNTILRMVKGTAEFEGQGESQKALDRIAYRRQFEGLIEKHIGTKEWDLIEKTIFDVPELAGNKHLNNGRITRGDVLVMMANQGNEGNRQRLRDGFEISQELVQTIVDRYLEPNHVDFVQGVMDMYKSYIPRIRDLELKTTGVEPSFVRGDGMKHRDRTLPGGYYPIRVLNTDQTLVGEAKRVWKNLNKTIQEKQGEIAASYYSQGMTEQGYLQQRTANTNPINISSKGLGDGFEEIIHDLNMRIPIRDAMTILQHPTIKQDLSAVAGESGYKTVMGTIVNLANATRVETGNAFGDSTAFFKQTLGHWRSGYSTAVLVANTSSLLIQPSSMLFAVEKMGASGAKHLALTLKDIAVNPGMLNEFYEFAAEIHPPIMEYKENLDEHLMNAIAELIPDKTSVPYLSILKQAQELIKEKGFMALGFVDQVQKVAVALGAYRQFMDGDAPGYSMESILKLTEKQRHDQAKAYAGGVVRTTLTSGSPSDKAPFQYITNAVEFGMFWNDARNVLNNSITISENIGYKSQESADEFSKGNWSGGAKAAGAAVSATMSMIMIRAIAELYGDKVRGLPTPFDDHENMKDPKEAAAFAYDFFVQSPKMALEHVIDTVPIARDVKFAAKKQGSTDYKNVQTPTTKMLSDFATAAPAVYDAVGELLQLNMPDMSETQMKSLAYSLSYLTGGFPVNGPFKFYRTFEDGDGVMVNTARGVYGKLNDTINKFLEKKDDIPPELRKELEELERQTRPPGQDSASLVPEDVLEKIKKLESNGKWWARNPNSSAAGLYQFTSGTWEDIMQRAPQLGLTVRGRVSANTAQQEKAIRWHTEDNARQLDDAGIEISVNSLYAAHFLGVRAAIKVLGAPGDAKLRPLVADTPARQSDVMTSNGFRPKMKVKDFKRWLSRKVNSVQDVGVDNSI